MPSPVERVVQRRQIKSLFHFTPFENLGVIQVLGLRSRSELGRLQLPFTATDGLRLDDAPWAISLSISWPNHFMLRQKLEQGQHLIVLELEPSVLWTNRCRFVPCNAASASTRPLLASGAGRTPAGSAARAAELEQLFGADSRTAFPIDVQAEVLVDRGPIAWSMVRRVLCASEGWADAARVVLEQPGLPVHHWPDAFAARPVSGRRATVSPTQRLLADHV